MFHPPDGNREAGYFHSRGSDEVRRETSFIRLKLYLIWGVLSLMEAVRNPTACSLTTSKNINSQECKWSPKSLSLTY